jgi:hypothetical protein
VAKRKRTKGQTTIYKTLQRKFNIEQHESHHVVLNINQPIIFVLLAVLVKWKIHGVHASGVERHVFQQKYFQEGENHRQEIKICIRVLAEIVLIEQVLFNIKNINMWFLINLHVRTIFIFSPHKFQVWFMVFNATFNNISVILWRSVLLMEETGGPGENHRPVANH